MLGEAKAGINELNDGIAQQERSVIPMPPSKVGYGCIRGFIPLTGSTSTQGIAPGLATAPPRPLNIMADDTDNMFIIEKILNFILFILKFLLFIVIFIIIYNFKY